MPLVAPVVFGCLVILIAGIAFAIHRRHEAQRILQVEAWIREFLVGRYGGLPDDLRINCTDDRLWPVLVSFNRKEQSTRHRLQFYCAGPQSSLALHSESEEQRPSAS